MADGSSPGYGGWEVRKWVGMCPRVMAGDMRMVR